MTQLIRREEYVNRQPYEMIRANNVRGVLSSANASIKGRISNNRAVRLVNNKPLRIAGRYSQRPKINNNRDINIQNRVSINNNKNIMRNRKLVVDDSSRKRNRDNGQSNRRLDSNREDRIGHSKNNEESKHRRNYKQDAKNEKKSVPRNEKKWKKSNNNDSKYILPVLKHKKAKKKKNTSHYDNINRLIDNNMAHFVSSPNSIESSKKFTKSVLPQYDTSSKGYGSNKGKSRDKCFTKPKKYNSSVKRILSEETMDNKKNNYTQSPDLWQEEYRKSTKNRKNHSKNSEYTYKSKVHDKHKRKSATELTYTSNNRSRKPMSSSITPRPHIYAGAYIRPKCCPIFKSIRSKVPSLYCLDKSRSNNFLLNHINTLGGRSTFKRVFSTSSINNLDIEENDLYSVINKNSASWPDSNDIPGGSITEPIFMRALDPIMFNLCTESLSQHRMNRHEKMLLLALEWMDMSSWKLGHGMRGTKVKILPLCYYCGNGDHPYKQCPHKKYYPNRL